MDYDHYVAVSESKQYVLVLPGNKQNPYCSAAASGSSSGVLSRLKMRCGSILSVLEQADADAAIAIAAFDTVYSATRHLQLSRCPVVADGILGMRPLTVVCAFV